MKQPWTKAQMLLALLSLTLLAVMFAQLASRWSFLPARVPTHFGFDGTIDGWGPKETLLGLPMIAATVCLVFLLVLNIPPSKWNMPCKIREENAPRVYSFTRSMLLILMTELTAFSALVQTFTLDAEPLPFGAVPTLGAVTLGTVAVLIFGIFRLNRPKPE